MLKFWKMCQSIYQVGDFLNLFPTVWATLEPSNPEIIHQRRYHLPSPRSLQLHNFFDLIWFNIFASSLHSTLIPIFLSNCMISTANLNGQSMVLFSIARVSPFFLIKLFEQVGIQPVGWISQILRSRPDRISQFLARRKRGGNTNQALTLINLLGILQES